MNTTLAGKRGEALAAEYLRKKGYTLLEAGYRSRYGEIDLIVKKRGIVAMVEVKSRKSDRFAKALEAVDAHKQQRLRLTALQWLGEQEKPPQIRFDVIEVYPGGEIHHLVFLQQQPGVFFQPFQSPFGQGNVPCETSLGDHIGKAHLISPFAPAKSSAPQYPKG